MATSTRTRSKKAEEENGTPEEAVTNPPENNEPNSADSSEEVNNTDQDDRAFTSFPETDDKFLQDTMEKIVEVALEVEDHNAVVLENSATDDGIQHIAENSDNPEIVEQRAERDEVGSRIAELEKELETLNANYEEKEKALYESAEDVLKENIDETKKLGAKMQMERGQKQIGSLLTVLRQFVDLDDSENVRFQEFIREVNSRVYKGQKMIPTGTATNGNRSQSDRDKSAEIRAWAKNNGIKVNDRGRIPQHVIDKYEKAINS